MPDIQDASTTYRVEDIGSGSGLNSSQITALFQDKDGFIWVGNKPGLSRFDGYTFTNFTHAEGHAIGPIHAIVQDSSGTLWAGGEGGLFFFDNTRFLKIPSWSGHIKDLHLDEAGRMWIVGLGFVPFILSPSERTQLLLGAEVKIRPIVSASTWAASTGPQGVWAVDTDRDGLAWFGLDHGHAYFDGAQLEVTWQDSSRNYAFCAIAAFHRDSVFWGTEKSGLLFQKGARLEKRNLPVTYMFAVTDSATYYLSALELLKLQGGRWTRLHALDEYAYIYSKKLLLDREGNFWIGGEGNLLKLTPARLQSWAYPDIHELFSNHAIAGLQDGSILIGGNSGRIHLKTAEGFSLYRRLEVPNYSYVSDIAVEPDGWIWYATSASGLAWQQAGVVSYFTMEDGLAENSQHLFFRDAEGGLWAGGERSITRIAVADDGQPVFKSFVIRDQSAGPPMFKDLMQSPDGKIFAVSDRGLFRLENKDLVRVPINGGETAFPVITGVAVGGEDQVWLATQGSGLWQCAFSGEDGLTLKRAWTEKEGLPGNVLLDVHIDRWKRVWTVSQSGLGYLTASDTSWTVQNLDQRDGWPRQTTSHSAFHESPDGQLWVMNFTSLVAVPIYDLPENRVAPQSFITRVQLFDGRENIFAYASNEAEQGPLPRDLRLPHDKNFLRFDFTSNSHTLPEKNRFRYRLQGLETEWNETEDARSVMYPGLQPGTYTFLLQAMNNDGVAERGRSAFRFSIQPAWYQTWWAYALMILSISGSIIFLYRFDLSRKLARQEARRLQELDAYKSRFFANLSHEFRTPLTLIQGPVRALLNGSFKENPKYQYQLILRNTRRLRQLIDQLLDLARVESGKASAQMEPHDLVAFFRMTCSAFESMATSRQVDFRYRADVDQLPLSFDPQMLERICFNLMSNAVKFTLTGGKVRVDLFGGSTPADAIRIRVEDNGVGISKEALPRIFERFYQAESTTVRSYEGSGIGLALAREYVELHGGRIEVASEEGRGSTFTVFLPATLRTTMDRVKPLSYTDPGFVKKAASLNGMKANGVLPRKDGQKPLVLVVEDNTDMQRFLRQCIQDEFSVIQAENGKSGLALAREHIPDLIVSDVMMPIMDGFSLCRALRNDARTSHIPLVLLTARAEAADRMQGIEFGAEAYLTKPFDADELRLRILKLIEHRALLQEKYGGERIGRPPDPDITPLDQQFLKNLQDLVEASIDDPDLSLQQLGKDMGMSRSQLHRKVKALTGVSPGTFLRRYRLQRASQLLRDPWRNISEVAFEVGFRSPSHFTKAFREEFGQTPSAYQQEDAG